MKTIDVNAKEWFDKVNGNSYFSMNITIDYGMKTERSFYVPIQYGYGDHYRHEAFREIQERKIIPKQNERLPYWQYYANKNIIARHYKQEKCPKREL